MKDISSSLIIDEAIKKLESIKNGQSDRFIVNELHAVRAYCDLLLKTYEKQTKTLQTTTKQIVATEKKVGKMLEDDDDSIFDF